MTPGSGESVISCADGQAVQPWQAEPYRLWSLLDMLRFGADSFIQAIGVLPQLWLRMDMGGLHREGTANELLVLVRGFMREAARELQEPP